MTEYARCPACGTADDLVLIEILQVTGETDPGRHEIAGGKIIPASAFEFTPGNNAARGDAVRDMRPLVAVPPARRDEAMTSPLVHLAMPARSGVSACGRWSKNCTSSAEDVTCETCRKTWDFALAGHRDGSGIISHSPACRGGSCKYSPQARRDGA